MAERRPELQSNPLTTNANHMAVRARRPSGNLRQTDVDADRQQLGRMLDFADLGIEVRRGAQEQSPPVTSTESAGEDTCGRLDLVDDSTVLYPHHPSTTEVGEPQCSLGVEGAPVGATFIMAMTVAMSRSLVGSPNFAHVFRFVREPSVAMSKAVPSRSLQEGITLTDSGDLADHQILPGNERSCRLNT